jgi:hypothetical protein
MGRWSGEMKRRPTGDVVIIDTFDQKKRLIVVVVVKGWWVELQPTTLLLQSVHCQSFKGIFVTRTIFF